jgi:peroxiredoxin
MNGVMPGNRWIGRTIAVLAVASLAAMAWTRRDRYTPLDEGRPAPDYVAVTLDGDSIGVHELRGRVVLLNVWATWCRPCIREMPALQRLYDKLEPLGFTVLAVSVDNAALALGDPAEAVRGFVEQYQLTFPILLDPDRGIESTYQISGMPTSYLIDRGGVIRDRVLGMREWDQPEFETEIRALLKTEG